MSVVGSVALLSNLNRCISNQTCNLAASYFMQSSGCVGPCVAALVHALRMSVLPLHQVRVTAALARDTCSLGNQVVLCWLWSWQLLTKAGAGLSKYSAAWESQTSPWSESLTEANNINTTSPNGTWPMLGCIYTRLHVAYYIIFIF